jgi:hypothetical protein
VSRNRLLWFGAIALLLLFGAWWFTAISAAVGSMRVLPQVIMPAVFLAASAVQYWIALWKRISGLFVLATTSLGIGLMGILSWFTSSTIFSNTGWLLLPAFTGLGILTENHLGIGWRFTDRLGISFVIASLGLFLFLLFYSFISSNNFKYIGGFFETIENRFSTTPTINIGQFILPVVIHIPIWR